MLGESPRIFLKDGSMVSNETKLPGFAMIMGDFKCICPESAVAYTDSKLDLT